MRKIADKTRLDSYANLHKDQVNRRLKQVKKNGELFYERSISYRLREYAKTCDVKYSQFFIFLESKLDDLILQEPKELLKTHDELISAWLDVDCSYTNLRNKIFPDLLEQVFRYDLFRDGTSDSSALISWFNNLNLKTCPYCNRNWMSFVKNDANENKLYFDIDHFFPKYKYPWFALSYYNLMPSCTICNQRVKGSKDLLLHKHIHPFVDDFDAIVKFVVPFETLDIFFDPDIELELELTPRLPRTETDDDFIRAKAYYEFFNLKNLYNSHLDYVRELLQKRIVYSQEYVDQLKEEYKDIFRSPDEISRMIFGNYVLPEHIHERPLAKLTKDLLEDII